MSEQKTTVEVKTWLRDGHGVRTHKWEALRVSNLPEAGESWMVMLECDAIRTHENKLAVWVSRGDLIAALERVK